MSGIGSASLWKHRDGGRLSRTQAILAKCADCCGDYVDERSDCEIPRCPLYPWQPYRETAGNPVDGDGGRTSPPTKEANPQKPPRSGPCGAGPGGSSTPPTTGPEAVGGLDLRPPTGKEVA